MSDRLKDYEEIRQLGKGSFGRAVLVRHVPTQAEYVMKIVAVQHMKPQERAEALQEANVLGQFNHPNIVAYKECFADQRYLYIIMEYADGGDLTAVIEQQRRTNKYFHEDQVCFYFVQVLLAMKHVHERHILHRDIKGQNIFLTKVVTTGGKIRFQVKIGDFGVSKILSSTLDVANTVIGTPYYMSPEICHQRGYNSKSDVWALGCILYELCTLQKVFDAQNLKQLVVKILEGKYAEPSAKTYSEDLRVLIKRMLQQNPDDRPSVQEILNLPFVNKWIPKLLPPEVIRKEFPNGIELKTEQKTFGDERHVSMDQAVSGFAAELTAMNSKESLAFRLEKTRVFLEKSLGTEALVELYNKIGKEEISQAEAARMLGQQSGLLNLVVQVVVQESRVNGGE